MTCRECILTTIRENEAVMFHTLERVCNIEQCVDFDHRTFEHTQIDPLIKAGLIRYNFDYMAYELGEQG